MAYLMDRGKDADRSFNLPAGARMHNYICYAPGSGGCEHNNGNASRFNCRAGYLFRLGVQWTAFWTDCTHQQQRFDRVACPPTAWTSVIPRKNAQTPSSSRRFGQRRFASWLRPLRNVDQLGAMKVDGIPLGIAEEAAGPRYCQCG